MRLIYLFLNITLFALILTGCKDEDPMVTGSINPDQPNILLIIADDVGKDPMSGFTEGIEKAVTPVIDQLRTDGLEFSNFWSNPVCSPTRSTILTGKYGYDTGVLTAGDNISPNETSLQAAINTATNNSYSTAIIGKWHLSSNQNAHPLDMGIDYYAGIWGGGVGNYYKWELTTNRETSNEDTYTTTKLTDLGIDWIEDQSKPWFLWMAYNAGHTPFHLPPSDLISDTSLSGDSLDIENNPLPYYLASIEAMDSEIGRMLESMDEETKANTIILFIGDNGTPRNVNQTPYSANGTKGTLFQGGINNPMIVSGKGVNRTGTEDALVNSTDFYVSILNIAGVETSTQNNSIDFSDLLQTVGEGGREYAYAEVDGNARTEWCIRNDRFKLIEDEDGNQSMFNLINDPYEADDLLLGNLNNNQTAAKLELEEELLNIRQ